MYIRSANGAVHEERFSGSKRTPNQLQMYWTVCRIRIDEGTTIDDLFNEPINVDDVPEYFVYELSKSGLGLPALAKRFNTTEERIQAILDNQLETAMLLERVKRTNDKRGRPMDIV